MSDIHWLKALSGVFETAADWSGGVVPGASDDAILDATGSPFTVTVSTSGTVNGIDLAANATLLIDATFTATHGTDGGANAGMIEVNEHARFLMGGMLTNTGSILLEGGPIHGVSAVGVIQTAVTLDGGGGVTLTGHSSIAAGDGKGAILTNVDNTISGSGYLGISSVPRLAVVNEAAGVIDANVTGGVLELRGDRPSTNTGLMEATNGGTLTVFDTSVGNTGGTIEATGGGKVDISFSGAVTGGAVYAGPGSTVYVFGRSTMTGAVLKTAKTGVLNFESACTVTTAGVVINAGTTVLGAAGGLGDTLIVDNNTTLTGGGTVAFYNSTIEGAGTASVLTNVDNKIIGWNELGNGRMVLVNRAAGVIETADSLLTIDTGTQTIINGGLIEVTLAHVSCVIQSPITNYGTLEAASSGLLEVDGPVAATSGKAIAAGGTLDFTSSFNQAVIFQGTGSVLELAQSQNYTGKLLGFSNTGGSTLDLVDIAFVSAGEATFSGTASGGTLTVTDGTHTARIALTGYHLGATFTASSDGHGGTDIVASATAAAARFIHAASTLRAGPPAAAGLAREAWRASSTLLAGPHTQIS